MSDEPDITEDIVAAVAETIREARNQDQPRDELIGRVVDVLQTLLPEDDAGLEDEC